MDSKMTLQTKYKKKSKNIAAHVKTYSSPLQSTRMRIKKRTEATEQIGRIAPLPGIREKKLKENSVRYNNAENKSR
jgi:hypothetical protein